MKQAAQSHPNSRQTTRMVRERIAQGGECLWRLDDFSDFPFAAAARALSRLAQEGFIQRLSKGVYYRPRQTIFGPSRPNPTAIQKLAARSIALFPSGISAASMLGFSTQIGKYGELATSAGSLPRKLIGQDTRVHTRRPVAWSGLSEMDAAILDLLRRGGATSELSPEATVHRMLTLLKESGRFQRLLAIAVTEPPRVRALLGAFGEMLKADRQLLKQLRASLNPLSRFDFGKFSSLPAASAWQAKKGRS